MQRLEGFLSGQCGLSRKQWKERIRAGRVTCNGAPVLDPARQIDPARDTICIDSEALTCPQRVVLLLHKPAGYLTATQDRQDKTVMDLLTGVHTRIYPVGRLDRDSEGLLLLTNDGALAQRLTHPSHEISKTYQVTVQGDTDGAAERLAAMRSLEGEPIAPVRVRVVRQEEGRALLELTLRQGKNRQIRRMCAQCGLTVLRLRRIREDCLTLGSLKAGTWRDLTPEEVSALKGETSKSAKGLRPGR